VRVLTAYTGTEPEDFTHTVAGELVMAAITCDRDRLRLPNACGCGRAWVGLASRKATSVARVDDRPDLTLELLADLIADSLRSAGWTDVAEWAREEAEDIAEIAAGFAEDTLVRRDVDEVSPA
jgi:hypothetical protein